MRYREDRGSVHTGTYAGRPAGRPRKPMRRLNETIGQAYDRPATARDTGLPLFSVRAFDLLIAVGNFSKRNKKGL